MNLPDPVPILRALAISASCTHPLPITRSEADALTRAADEIVRLREQRKDGR